ncbi:hypothetical protein Bbelb_253670 [Branchiostoma belcheri]|nr:hypothetical protein Bbelb_253670 [Branchiostoma belcheri]
MWETELPEWCDATQLIVKQRPMDIEDQQKDVRLLNSPHPQPHEQQDFQAAAPPGGMHQNCTHYFGTGERFMFGLVFTAGRSRLARRRHRIEGARPIDPWRATIIQAENWAEYLGVELSSALRMHATALSVFFSCRFACRRVKHPTHRPGGTDLSILAKPRFVNQTQPIEDGPPNIKMEGNDRQQANKDNITRLTNLENTTSSANVVRTVEPQTSMFASAERLPK